MSNSNVSHNNGTTLYKVDQVDFTPEIPLFWLFQNCVARLPLIKHTACTSTHLLASDTLISSLKSSWTTLSADQYGTCGDTKGEICELIPP